MKKLCEIEGIKFYDTPEIGIACRVSEINTVVSGVPNRGSFRRDMIDYKHVEDAFPNSEDREKQIQYLEYFEMGQKLFISLQLILVHLNRGKPNKYKEGYDRVLHAIKENSILKSTPAFIAIKEILPQGEEDSILKSTSHSTNQKESKKELCEIEGIKFYDTPEMGVACRMSEINIAITEKSNRGNFRKDMLKHKCIRDAFPDPEKRDKQIQDLEYLGTSKQLFISLQLIWIYLKGSTPNKYKERYDAILRGIEEEFPDLKETASDSDIPSDSGTIPDLDTIPPTQPKLPGIEKTYSYLYIAKGLDTESSPPRIRDIHFGITADGLKDRIKDIEKGNYYVGELVATIAFEGTQRRSDGSIVASEDCADLEKWFKTNPDWQNVRGKKETFLYKEPWISLLESIEKSEKMGPPFYALYPGDSVINELVPPHLISRVHDFGESLEMIEIARLYKGNVIPDEKNLSVSFDGDWIVVQGLHRVKKR
ncbi:MAG: hypothetical protein OXD49_17805 [Candidatus Poribacteria bacterium]|nr:hypothetical protein [Candidatus Poribacteria bacterium]